MGTLESLVSLRLRAINDSEAATAAEQCDCTVRSAEILIVARLCGKTVSPSECECSPPLPIQIHSNAAPKAFDFQFTCTPPVCRLAPERAHKIMISKHDSARLVASRSRTTMNGRICVAELPIA